MATSASAGTANRFKTRGGSRRLFTGTVTEPQHSTDPAQQRVAEAARKLKDRKRTTRQRG